MSYLCFLCLFVHSALWIVHFTLHLRYSPTLIWTCDLCYFINCFFSLIILLVSNFERYKHLKFFKRCILSPCYFHMTTVCFVFDCTRYARTMRCSVSVLHQYMWSPRYKGTITIIYTHGAILYEWFKKHTLLHYKIYSQSTGAVKYSIKYIVSTTLLYFKSIGCTRYNTCDKVCQWLAAVFPTNNWPSRYNWNMLKVALNTITLTLYFR